MKAITITIKITLLVSMTLTNQGIRAHEHKKDAHPANGSVSISATFGNNTTPELTTASGSHSSSATTGANPVIAVAATAGPHVGGNGSVLVNIVRVSDSTISAPSTATPKQSGHSGHGGRSHDRPDRHDGTQIHSGHGGHSHRGHGMG